MTMRSCCTTMERGIPFHLRRKTMERNQVYRQLPLTPIFLANFHCLSLGSSGPRKTVAEKIQASVSSSSSSSAKTTSGDNSDGATNRNGSNGNAKKPEKVETFSVDDDDEEDSEAAKKKQEAGAEVGEAAGNGGSDKAPGDKRPV